MAVVGNLRGIAGYDSSVDDSGDSLVLLWQELRFKLMALQCTAGEFEQLFSAVMRLTHPETFHVSRPAGRQGDLKCDGWDSKSRTLFSVYAPFSRKSQGSVSEKIITDFGGARREYPEMRFWRFVHNDLFGLSAKVTRALQDLRNDSARDGVEVLADWGPEQIWRELLAAPGAARSRLLGGPPESWLSTHEALTKVPVRFHSDVPPAALRPAIRALASLCENFEPTSVLDALCATVISRALMAWWLHDEKLFEDYLEAVRERSLSTPFEAQVTTMCFLMRTTEVCAKRLRISPTDLLQSQLSRPELGRGEKLILQIALEELNGTGIGFLVDDDELRFKFVQGCLQAIIDLIGMTSVGGWPAIFTLQDVIVSTQRIDYAEGRIV